MTVVILDDSYLNVTILLPTAIRGKSAIVARITSGFVIGGASVFWPAYPYPGRLVCQATRLSRVKLGHVPVLERHHTTGSRPTLACHTIGSYRKPVIRALRITSRLLPAEPELPSGYMIKDQIL